MMTTEIDDQVPEELRDASISVHEGFRWTNALLLGETSTPGSTAVCPLPRIAQNISLLGFVSLPFLSPLGVGRLS